MQTNLIEKIKQQIVEFKEMTSKYYNKEISLKEYKGYSGGFGSYGERGGNSFMLRLRMNQGVLTKDKMKFICDSINKYNVEKLHLTTCQTIQMHKLTPQSVGEIMEEALDHDIVCRGGGDFPRNVMTSPLSGVNVNETFDVLPYAKACSDYLLSVMLDLHLPRKLKVAFENDVNNPTHATFRDLGFVAKSNGNFDVYCAGGLGQNPKMGVLVKEDALKEDVLYYVRAMILIFIENGNYENRAKARTRYMQDTLGIEGLKKAFNKNLEIAYKENLKINPQIIKINKKSNSENTIKNWRVIKQKQEGLYTVMCHPIAGDISIEEFISLYNCIKDMDGVEIRIAPDQNIYIINLNANEALEVLEKTNFGAKNVFETSVSCVGATVCQVGFRDSKGLLLKLVEGLRKYDFANGTLPRMHISCCPSSCGTHQIGLLGFRGSVKLVDKIPTPAFTMYVYGNDLLTKERFGKELGTVCEDEILAMLVEIAKSVQANKTNFEDWYNNNEEVFNSIVSKYTA